MRKRTYFLVVHSKNCFIIYSHVLEMFGNSKRTGLKCLSYGIEEVYISEIIENDTISKFYSENI